MQESCSKLPFRCINFHSSKQRNLTVHSRSLCLVQDRAFRLSRYKNGDLLYQGRKKLQRTFEHEKFYYLSQREISNCESGSNLQRCVPIAFSRVDGSPSEKGIVWPLPLSEGLPSTREKAIGTHISLPRQPSQSLGLS